MKGIKVHILATVRKSAMLDAALLVFRTLRVGFPTAEVTVWGNGIAPRLAGVVADAAGKAGARFVNGPGTSHDVWVEGLLLVSGEAFWICDTDVVLWQCVERWFEHHKRVGWAGRFEREFDEEWTNTIHVARLHTALMWLNPAVLRGEMRAWMAKIPAPWGQSGQFPLVRQTFIPRRGGKTLFYDTCAGLYHALEGTPFTEEQDAAFDHLHCATYADLISLKGLRESHLQIYEDIDLARGIRKRQDVYYAERATNGMHELQPTE